MSKQNVNLDELFMNQFEKMSEEELANVDGGARYTGNNGWLAALQVIADVAEGGSGAWGAVYY
ncbi:MAG: Blp family class II bacteriocin [Streptococcaceae bacterium]|jgi:bacteriocin-like protein|nr:Blp family class II bacteriocin [Streptococcaceae bacterium]